MDSVQDSESEQLGRKIIRDAKQARFAVLKPKKWGKGRSFEVRSLEEMGREVLMQQEEGLMTGYLDRIDREFHKTLGLAELLSSAEKIPFNFKVSQVKIA